LLTHFYVPGTALSGRSRNGDAGRPAVCDIEGWRVWRKKKMAKPAETSAKIDALMAQTIRIVGFVSFCGLAVGSVIHAWSAT